MDVAVDRIIPVLRIFDVAEADEFSLGFLGFGVDRDRCFDAGAPLYRQVSRDGLVLRVSEHHGDGSPGVHLRVMMRGAEALQREVAGRACRRARPGLETTPRGAIETGVIDPFGNAIRFCERIEPGSGG